MSKTKDRTHPDYWSRRLFRSTYLYRGEVREATGWWIKIQWQGVRRTLRLMAGAREAAAREAAAIFEGLRRGGWAEIERIRGRELAPPLQGARVEGGGARVLWVGQRKYVSDLNPRRTREYFAEIGMGGRAEFIALGTEDPDEAPWRAGELAQELAEVGWDRLWLRRSREVTVAVFWQANPMACTYTTLLTQVGRGEDWGGVAGGRTGGGGRVRGWRVLLVEPDEAARRAIVYWLSRSAELEDVDGVANLEEAGARGGGGWHLVVCRQDLATSGMRGWAQTAGVGGGRPEFVVHGLYRDSDAIFASVSGVTQGYFLRRVLPGRLLEPLMRGSPEGLRHLGDWERHVRRYFQDVFEPEAKRGESVSVAGLTSRETDVLELLRRGCVDKEIARELGISVWTVHSHLKRIFAKYGVRTRTEAVVRHLQK